MNRITETVDIDAPAEQVFSYIDDIRNIARHMTGESSMAMMGSRLTLEVVSPRPTGVGATYRYCGRVAGLTLDFTETVVKYVVNREKVWRTVGKPRLLIMSFYEMRVAVEPTSPTSARLTVSIAYELPRSRLWWLVGTLLSSSYSRWCLRRICVGTKRVVERHPAQTSSTSRP